MSGGGNKTKVKETPAEKEYAAIGEEKLDLFFQEIAPAQDQYMAMVDRLGSGAMRERAAGIGNVESQIAGNQAIQGAIQNLSAGGMNPNSGQFESVLSQGTTALGEAAANSMNQAREALSQDYITGVQNVVGMGMRQGTQAQKGAATSAAIAASDETARAFDAFSREQANKQLGGMAVGAGMRGFIRKQTTPDWNAPAASGVKYNTDPYSDQSLALSRQDRGFGSFARY